MVVREVEAKSLLRKHKKIDSWFLSWYGMNLYRGCQHNCVYCDGRAEGYYVDGEFGQDVTVKTNAIEVLRRELDPTRKRTPFKRGYVMVGGGVGDSYQPVEKTYELTRQTLQLLCEKHFPVHVLTKSTLVRRDADLLKQINEQSRAIVSVSVSSTDERMSRIFEPGVPSPQERLEVLSFYKDQGVAVGLFLLPVIPFITDSREILEQSIRDAADAGVDFIIFGGMTLKQGRQYDYFLRTLEKHYPELRVNYQMVYKGGKWGEATPEYYHRLHQTFHLLMKHCKIPLRIPPWLYQDLLYENDVVVVMLEHLDYLLKLQGKRSPFGYAAYQISQLQEPVSSHLDSLRAIKGVGPTTESLIREVVRTGRCSTYEELLFR